MAAHNELLCSDVLEYRAEVHARFAIQDIYIDIAHKLRRQKTDVTLVELEHTAVLRPHQRECRLCGPSNRDGHSSMCKPIERGLQNGELKILPNWMYLRRWFSWFS